MTRNIAKIYQGQKVITAEGTLEPWFVDAWNDLVDRSGGETVNAVGNLINGTQPVSDTIIDGLGQLTSLIASLSNDVNALATAAGVGGGLAATANRSTVTNNTPLIGAGTAVTQSVTITPAGGTGPYTYAWTKVTGDTFVIGSATAATTDFSVNLGDGNRADAIYRCTVTDSVLATTTKDITVSGVSTPDL